jgi:hypothetical protein
MSKAREQAIAALKSDIQRNREWLHQQEELLKCIEKHRDEIDGPVGECLWALILQGRVVGARTGGEG